MELRLEEDDARGGGGVASGREADPPAAQSLEQGPRHTYQSKASIMRRYVQEGVANEVKAVTKVYYFPLS